MRIGMILISVLLFIYIAGFWFAPFPYWRTYFILWKYVLFYPEKKFSFRNRRRQIRLLLACAFFCPFQTFLWYLDELFFPHYKQQKVRPVFIIGQPRSGTTFLHRTLAADEKTFFAIRHIEWRYPYITVQKLMNYFGLADKLKYTMFWPNTEAGRRLNKMHASTLYDWQEDAVFFHECFWHHFFVFLFFPYPPLLQHVDSFLELPDKVQQHILRIHRKVIQKVMYLRKGNKIYLSKETTSHNKFGAILRLYPEAKFIVMARQSSDSLSSLLEMIRSAAAMRYNIDLNTLSGWKDVFIERMRSHSLLLVDLSENQIDRENQSRLSFDRLLNNIVPSVMHIYAQLGLKPSNSYLQYLEELQRQQQNRERGYEYIKSQFEGFERFDRFVSEIDKEHHSILIEYENVYN